MPILTRRLAILPASAIMLGAVIMIVLFYLATRNVIQTERNIYDVEVARLKDVLTRKLTVVEEVLNGIKVVFHASTFVDSDEFFSISQDALSRHTFIKYTSYLQLISHKDRASFEAAIQDQGYPTFTISELKEGRYVSARQRTLYLPVVYQEPFVPETAGRLGLDYLSIPTYASRIRLAIDTNKMQTTMPEQTLDSEQGFTVFKSIYAGKAAPGPTNERRASANGIVLIRVDVSRLLEKDELPADINLTMGMRSKKISGAIAPLISLNASPTLVQWNIPKLHEFETYHDIDIGSQTIQLGIRKELRWNKKHFWIYFGAMLIGLVVTALLWSLARTIKMRADDLNRRNREVQHLVNIRTQELAREKEKAQITLESIADAVITVNASGDVDYLNPVAERLTEQSERYITGHPITEAVRFVDQLTNMEAENPVVTSMRTGQPLFDHGKLAVLTPSGTAIAVDVSAAPLRDRQHVIAGGVLAFRDVSEARNLTQKITHQATHDALTGLPNRTLLRERLELELSHAPYHVATFAVMFLDLDRFKIINDSLGHDVGDALLQIVAQRLNDCLREEDMVARLGGDEFVIILSDVTNRNDIEMIAKKLLFEINQAYSVKQHDIYTSASIGIAIYPEGGIEAGKLMRNADAAMYRAKLLGKNKYVLYTHDMTTNNKRQLSLDTDMRRAIKEHEFRLHYQPQIDLQTGAIVGAEALLRWQHPEYGLLPPSEFLDLAEENGLITEIGRWVLLEACRQNKQWQTDGLPPLLMAVNIADRQFHDAQFAEKVQSILQECRLEARYLDLELTEGILATHSDASLNSLKHLKQLGVSFSIDDFGTGYSSLAYLKRFPLDTIKIDRSFVRDITTDHNDAEICSAIIAMARNLNLHVIAEGVEEKSQLSFLLEQGCDGIQGYYFSPPVPADEFAALLREDRFSGSLAEDINKAVHGS